jgi:hypothetical protein
VDFGVTVDLAAKKLIAHVMTKHGLTSIDQLQCEHMRALAEALKTQHHKRKHGPAKPKRGIGIHNNADMFKGR